MRELNQILERDPNHYLTLSHRMDVGQFFALVAEDQGNVDESASLLEAAIADGERGACACRPTKGWSKVCSVRLATGKVAGKAG